MILITKAEKEAIREKFSDIHIVRTMRQRSKRGRYYMEEAPRAMRYLKEVRTMGVVETHTPECTRKTGRKDVRNADRKSCDRI